ncbi:energy-coupling factor ABC transporter permease [Catenovulum sp. 2E275]|uniref:energy-coupling factor ABC transporter permease n=1 Tax=Catenovulum sp. 2E275 TaxID=2980497 RepID=UPI0021D0B69D|nr:energy-coupling factor ABC transporter permease [Catenovulum sp. 2E275]MCU4674514.1 energy-coupling factor ABC transporter permease [Catenovulum sp. 2E275]
MLFIFSFVCFALILYFSFDKQTLALLITQKQKQHLFFGYTALLFFLWSIQTAAYPGLNVHFLWLCACTLYLGPRLALFSGLFALIGNFFYLGEDWLWFAIHYISGVFVPVMASYLVYMLAYHKLPRHLFIYIFVCGFFGGAIAIGSKMLVMSLFYAASGLYSWQILFDNYLILLVLLAFPEAMLNGMSMSIGIIYMPHWVRTFYDEDYIDKQ